MLSNLYLRSSTHPVFVCVSLTSQKHSCFQEIHTLQSKKTDVGELEKEREEAVQRLQVSLLLTQLLQPTTVLETITGSTNVYHGNHPEERIKKCQVRVPRSL